MAAFEFILLLYFQYVVFYTVIFSVAGFFYKNVIVKKSSERVRFCVLIPAYKEDAILLETVKRNLEQSYPSDFFKIVVIADGLRPATLAQLFELPVMVIKVQFAQSTKVKSLAKALQLLPNDFDYGIV